MQLRQFTPHQPPDDIRITPHEGRPDPEVSIKQNDLYARAWECENEKPIFDAENSHTTPPNSPELPVQPDLSTEEAWNTPGTAKECWPEFFPQMEELCDVRNTYSDMEPDVETVSE